MMKRVLLATLLLTLIVSPMLSNNSREGLLRGYDGGMMLHTGLLRGEISPIGHKVVGMPMGIGGVVRLNLGNHWRIGSEGYTSKLSQLNNGSYIKYGWGGLLFDYSYTIKRVKLYAGLTLGGGGCSEFFIIQPSPSDWQPIAEGYFQESIFMAVDPFIGCEYLLTDALHLTLKTDWLCAISQQRDIPMGPRLYFGFIFCH